MECREVHRLIPQYIKENIPDKLLVEFISHVRNCPSCYHELETYYMIHKAIKVLDEDCHASYDLLEMMVKDLEKKENRIKQNKKIKIYVSCYIFVLLILIVVMGLMSILPDDYNLWGYFMEWFNGVSL